MKPWHLRIAGLAVMALGSYLFILAVRDLTGEGAQAAIGLASVFCVSFGFGLLVLPWEAPTESCRSGQDALSSPDEPIQG